MQKQSTLTYFTQVSYIFFNVSHKCSLSFKQVILGIRKNLKNFFWKIVSTRTQSKIINIQPESFKINPTQNVTIKRAPILFKKKWVGSGYIKIGLFYSMQDYSYSLKSYKRESLPA